MTKKMVVLPLQCPLTDLSSLSCSPYADPVRRPSYTDPVYQTKAPGADLDTESYGES